MNLDLLTNSEPLFFLAAILLALPAYFRAKRKLVPLLLRCLCLLSLYYLIWPPKISEDVDEVPMEAGIGLIDHSSSMSDEAIIDCESQLKSKGVEPLYFSENLSENRLTNGNNAFTNFESSLKELSQKLKNREVLICSDGNETKGDINNVISTLRENKIQLTPIYPDSRLLSSSGVKITSMKLPLKASQGDKIPLSFTLENQTDESIQDKVEISVDDKNINEIKDSIASSSSKSYTNILESLKPGRHKVTITSNKSNSSIHKWINIEENLKPLILHSDEEESMLLRKIYPILGSKPEHILLNDSKSLPDSLESYNTIILNDIPASKLSSDFIGKLKVHISSGKRLVILGGDSSYGLGKYQTSPLTELSPLEAVPPRAKVERLPSAVILVVDKSGSMAEQGKIMAARMAALSSIESLKDNDFVGVIGFDSGPLAVIELAPVAQVKPEARERLQSNLQARGHTNLLPALSLARLRLSNIKAGRKHIIVLSDGQIPQSGSDAFVSELNRIRGEKITISTVALGYEADVPFMKMVAQAGKGSFYQTLDPSRLPKLFVDDIKVSVGEDTISEQSDYSVQKGPADLISVTTNVPPSLNGFIETKLKAGASLELITNKGEEDFPVLASMNIGAGRSIALATDLQGRWSKGWLRWSELVRFVGDLSSTEGSGKGEGIVKEAQYDFRYTVSGGLLNIELFIYDKSSLQGNKQLSLELRSGSGNTNSTLQFKELDPGLFSANLAIKESGDYFLNGNIGSLQIKDLGISISPNDLGEVKGLGINYDFLEKLRNETKREVKKNTETKAAATGKETNERYLDTSNLIYLALVLLVLEVLLRERKIKKAKVRL